MENETRFDLTAALENWRQELAAQSALTDDDRRELETHLRDALAGFQQRGLTDEESFWLARRRIGQPPQLAEEYLKADPAKAWRGTVLWIAISFLGVSIWQQMAILNMMFLIPGFFNPVPLLPEWMRYYVPVWLASALRRGLLQNITFIVFSFLPVCFVWIGVYAVRGRMIRVRSIWQFLSKSRSRFIFLSLALVVLTRSLRLAYLQHLHTHWGASGLALTNMTLDFCWQLSLIAIIAWLLPVEKSKFQTA